MCSKNFENRSTNKDFMPKINFEQGFCIGKTDNPGSYTVNSGNIFDLNK